jgi:cytochrome d ubiquinol oxidase subunit II
VGNFWDLLNIYSIIGGLVTLTGFTLHGAIFLSMKLDEPFGEKMNHIASRLWYPNVIVLLVFVITTYLFTDIINQLGVNPGVVPIGAILSLFSVGYLIFIKRNGWAFFMNSLTVVFSAATIFMILFPRLLVSNIDPSFSLTIMNSASGDYTLRIMSIIALIFVPIVIGYQSWSYWIFRKRIGSDEKSLHY